MHSLTVTAIAERRAEVARLTRMGYSAPKIAEKLSLSTRTVQRARKITGCATPSPRPWSREEDQIARNLLADGASTYEVARTIGRAQGSVATRFAGLSKCTPKDGPMLRELRARLETI